MLTSFYRYSINGTFILRWVWHLHLEEATQNEHFFNFYSKPVFFWWKQGNGGGTASPRAQRKGYERRMALTCRRALHANQTFKREISPKGALERFFFLTWPSHFAASLHQNAQNLPRIWPEWRREMIAFKAIQLHDDQWLSLRPCRNWLVSTCQQHLYIKIIEPRTHFLFWLLGDDSIYALLPLPAYGSDK